MTTTYMTIRDAVRTISALPVDDSILIRGIHGIGKSAIAKGIRKARLEIDGIDREVIDRRLSQMIEGDMLGMPKIQDDGTTADCPRDWFKKACLTPCILLLEEMNRAEHSIMQGAFQIILDRELAGEKLHPQTIVVSCINAGAKYTVNEMDPALLDRFFVIDLKPDKEDFRIWASELAKTDKNGKPRHNILPMIWAFLNNNDSFLDPTEDGELGEVQCSRRSWERFSDSLVHNNLDGTDWHDDTLTFKLAVGRVGSEAAIALRTFAMRSYRQLTGEDVIDKFDDKEVQEIMFKDGFEDDRELRLTIDDLNEVIRKVGAYVNGLESVTDEQGQNLHRFMQIIPHELRLILWSACSKGGAKKQLLVTSVHKHVVQDILDVYGTKLGEEGIGMVANSSSSPLAATG